MIARIEHAFVIGNRWLLIALMGLMACLVFTNVVLRYLTDQSIVWAEEVARYLMVWLTFTGAGLVLRVGGHIAIDNVHDAVPEKVGAVLRGMLVAALAGFFSVMIYYGTVYAEFMRFQTTPATGISFAWIYAAFPFGFALLSLHLLFIARRYVLARQFKPSEEMDAAAMASL